MGRRSRAKGKQLAPAAIALLLVALVSVLVIIAVELHNANQSYSFPYGMMSGRYNQSSIFGMTGSYAGSEIRIGAAMNSTKTLQPYARVAANNTIIFNSSNVSITVLAMGPERAENLTGKSPPSYVQVNNGGNVFVIDNMINPVLVIPAGAALHITFVNLDSSESHNMIISGSPPPYSYMPYQAMSSIVSMMPLIQHASYPAGEAYEYSYSAVLTSSGTLWYLCMYPGHAQMGMYGKIVVT